MFFRKVQLQIFPNVALVPQDLRLYFQPRLIFLRREGFSHVHIGEIEKLTLRYSPNIITIDTSQIICASAYTTPPNPPLTATLFAYYSALPADPEHSTSFFVQPVIEDVPECRLHIKLVRAYEHKELSPQWVVMIKGCKYIAFVSYLFHLQKTVNEVLTFREAG